MNTPSGHCKIYYTKKTHCYTCIKKGFIKVVYILVCVICFDPDRLKPQTESTDGSQLHSSSLPKN